MKKILFILVFFSFPFASPKLSAQPPIQWQKCLGGDDSDSATSTQQTSDGGYIVAGTTLSNNGDVSGNQGFFDFWVVKLDNLGAIEWEKTLGGSNHDLASTVRQTTDEGFIVVGVTESTDGDVLGNHGDKDAWVVKLSNMGVLEWQKALGSSGWDAANSIELTVDGGFIIAGVASANDGDVSGNQGFQDFWVVKLNSSGAMEWQKSLGGTSDDYALSIKPTFDGGYIVVGETLSNDGDVSGNNGNVDFWVVKLNSLGDIEWQNALGGGGLDVASDVVETTNGFVVCGYTGSHNSGDVTGHHSSLDYWIVKLAKTGELLWQKCYGGNNFDYARSIVQTNDGMFLIAGEVKSTDGDVEGNFGTQMIWVLKLNELGGIVWKKILGGTDGEGSGSIQQTNDNGYILAGYSWSNDGDVSGNHGSSDFWIVKLSPGSTPTSTPLTQPLDIFPNPASHTITLQIASEEPTLSLFITDFLGRQISQHTISNGESVDIATLPTGLYLLTATTPSGKVFSGKLRNQE
ncbi:MAG: T9SS type A sorting domain-containing protein [Saprospiraceae bacterium]